MDPELKGLLHQSFREGGITLKEWFIQRVTRYLDDKDQQIPLFEGKTPATRKVG